MLELREVHARYGAIVALREISIEVGEGELVGLLGANGAGKTTTLSVIAGSVRPDAGTVRFCGESIAGLAPEKVVRKDLAQMGELFPILRERLDQPAGTLSGGEQQQLAIARALMSHPRLLMLDEPSLGLAPRLVERVFELIAKLREEGVTILLVEQNASQALAIVDRAYLISMGRVEAAGRPEELHRHVDIESIYLGTAQGAPERVGP